MRSTCINLRQIQTIVHQTSSSLSGGEGMENWRFFLVFATFLPSSRGLRDYVSKSLYWSICLSVGRLVGPDFTFLLFPLQLMPVCVSGVVLHKVNNVFAPINPCFKLMPPF